VDITFDPAKRARTLRDRGLDFLDAVWVFAGHTFEIEDDRRDYGERRVFSMRKANDREKKEDGPRLGL
jgi:uncharacterized DUF497 family protein